MSEENDAQSKYPLLEQALDSFTEEQKKELLERFFKLMADAAKEEGN